jgi:hypothetical protein
MAAALSLSHPNPRPRWSLTGLHVSRSRPRLRTDEAAARAQKRRNFRGSFAENSARAQRAVGARVSADARGWVGRGRHVQATGPAAHRYAPVLGQDDSGQREESDSAHEPDRQLRHVHQAGLRRGAAHVGSRLLRRAAGGELPLHSHAPLCPQPARRSLRPPTHHLAGARVHGR